MKTAYTGMFTLLVTFATFQGCGGDSAVNRMIPSEIKDVSDLSGSYRATSFSCPAGATLSGEEGYLELNEILKDLRFEYKFSSNKVVWDSAYSYISAAFLLAFSEDVKLSENEKEDLKKCIVTSESEIQLTEDNRLKFLDVNIIKCSRECHGICVVPEGIIDDEIKVSTLGQTLQLTDLGQSDVCVDPEGNLVNGVILSLQR